MSIHEGVKPSFAVTNTDLRAAFDRMVCDNMKPLTLGFGLHYLAFAAKHALTLSEPAASIMGLTSGAAGLLMLGFRLVLQRWHLPAHWSHPILMLMGALLLGTNFLHLGLVHEPHQTVNLIVIVIGAGFVLLSTHWLALFIAALLSGWSLVVWNSPPSSAWSYYAFALFAATLFSVVVHIARLRTLRRLETLRLQEQQRAQQLEAALQELRLMDEQLRRHAAELENTVAERTRRVLELERLQRESEKLAATGRMAARIAHEINNPLGTIKTAFKLLSPAVPREYRHHHYLAKIEKEIDRIAGIVRQMLDLHQPLLEEQRAVRADYLIGDVLELIKPQGTQRGIALQADLKQAQTRVRLQEHMLRQILYNIVLNAIEASPESGQVHVVAVVTNQCLEVRVSDQGPGIPSHIAEQIFEPFFTTKSRSLTGGMGLGLSISKSLVEAMKGMLTFESENGKGTTCRIVIPLS